MGDAPKCGSDAVRILWRCNRLHITFISASGWVGSTGFVGSVAELESQSEHPLFSASFAEDLKSDSLDFVIYTFKLQMWLFLIQVLLDQHLRMELSGISRCVLQREILWLQASL